MKCESFNFSKKRADKHGQSRQFLECGDGKAKERYKLMLGMVFQATTSCDFKCTMVITS